MKIVGAGLLFLHLLLVVYANEPTCHKVGKLEAELLQLKLEVNRLKDVFKDKTEDGMRSIIIISVFPAFVG